MWIWIYVVNGVDCRGGYTWRNVQVLRVENFILIQTNLQNVHVQQAKVDFYVRFGFNGYHNVSCVITFP